MSIFERFPTYSPDAGAHALPDGRVAEQVAAALGEPVRLVALELGQGLNFVVRRERDDTPVALCKVRRTPGYPSAGAHREAEALLSDAGVPHPALLLDTSADDGAPYGFLLLEWVEGTALAPVRARYDKGFETWIARATSLIRSLAGTRAPGFGSLALKHRYATLAEYAADLEGGIAHSFGSVLREVSSFDALEDAGVVSSGFGERTVGRVAALAARLRWESPPTLLHGDLFAANCIETESGPVFIDWAEALGGAWMYEVGRLLHYIDEPTLLASFAAGLDAPVDDDARLAVQLERIRHAARDIFKLGLSDAPTAALRSQSRTLERRVETLLLEAERWI